LPPVGSLLVVREAEDVAIGAEVVEQRLLVSQDPGLLRLSDELDHVALLGDALSVDERMEKARGNGEVRDGSDVGNFIGPVSVAFLDFGFKAASGNNIYGG
jgi:hypothetical protein